MPTLLNPRTASQSDDILDHLKRGGSLTPLDAWEKYGCARLGARIWDLKRAGFDIVADYVQVRTGRGRPARVASYRLNRESEQADAPL